MAEKSEMQEIKFCQEQYDRLKRCSINGDTTEWNQWRIKHPKDDICLDRAPLHGFKLKNILLTKGRLDILEDGTEIYLEGEVYLREAFFRSADLENARFDRAHLEGADFYISKINGADFGRAYLQGTSFKLAVVNSATLFWDKETETEKDVPRPCCRISKETNFEGVPLDSVRIDPHTKQLLEYNIRCKNWKDWYKKNPLLKWSMGGFWWISNYGMSTWRIIWTFFLTAFAFAAIYVCAELGDLRLISNLVTQQKPVTLKFIGNGIIEQQNTEPQRPDKTVLCVRAIYFSIVTMTTLGFGDMYADPNGVPGHALLIIHVLLGYVFLGALVTRFGILFTSGGPSYNYIKKRRRC